MEIKLEFCRFTIVRLLVLLYIKLLVFPEKLVHPSPHLQTHIRPDVEGVEDYFQEGIITKIILGNHLLSSIYFYENIIISYSVKTLTTIKEFLTLSKKN